MWIIPSPVSWAGSPTLSAACPDEVKYEVADRVRGRIERMAAQPLCREVEAASRHALGSLEGLESVAVDRLPAVGVAAARQFVFDGETFVEPVELGMVPGDFRLLGDFDLAEEALQESARQYELLFKSLEEASCLLSVVFDAAGEPVLLVCAIAIFIVALAVSRAALAQDHSRPVARKRPACVRCDHPHRLPRLQIPITKRRLASAGDRGVQRALPYQPERLPDRMIRRRARRRCRESRARYAVLDAHMGGGRRADGFQQRRSRRPRA